MNDRLSAKLRMYKRLLATTKRFNSWQAVPAFVAAVQVLETEIKAIEALNPFLQGDNSGSTEDKNMSKESMIEETLAISGALQAYAHEIGSKELETKSTITRTDFHNAKEMDADDLALHIYQLGVDNLTHIADFGASQTELDALALRIESFSGRIGQPRDILTSTKEARKLQQSHFDTADSAVQKKMDNMIALFKKKDIAFYEAYQSARAVIRTGGKTETKEEEPAKA